MALRDRLAVAALVALIALSPFIADHAGADEGDVRAVLADRAAAHGIGSWAITTTASCESDLDPYAVGRQGELGLMQLAPWGLLPVFYRLGYTNPWSVWQQADFGARMFAAGEATHWSCYWMNVIGRRPPWWR